MSKPTVTELAKAAGISKSYACEILNDRAPARSLAIHIMRKTGWRHAILDDLTNEQIEVLESVEPWLPKAERAA